MENNENINAAPKTTSQEPVIEKNANASAGNQLAANSPEAAYGLWLTNKSALDLRHTASWTKFLAILGIVGCAIMLIAGIFMLAVTQKVDTYACSVYSCGQMVLLGFIYIVLSVVCFFPVLSFLSFSNKTKKAYDNHDNKSLSSAIDKLHFTFKFYGVMTIIILALYFLILIFAVIGAMMQPLGAGID